MSASDNAALDIHAVDPARLSREAREDFGMATRVREIRYKGHRIEIWDDVHRGIQFCIDGPKFKTPTYSANSLYDAEIKARGTLDQVID